MMKPARQIQPSFARSVALAPPLPGRFVQGRPFAARRPAGTRQIGLSKRLFDVVLALLLLPLLAPVMLVVVVVLAVAQGRPFFHVSERMKSPTEGFALWKFRTMTGDAADGGISGGHKVACITPIGRILRRTRADELPQLWNILKGDMSFVGPRPPLRAYVERFPGIYGQVLKSRPGVTGLASLHYHRHEERLLARCTTPEESDGVYVRSCMPMKARLDLIYQDHASLGFDILLLLRTIRRVLS